MRYGPAAFRAQRLLELSRPRRIQCTRLEVPVHPGPDDPPRHMQAPVPGLYVEAWPGGPAYPARVGLRALTSVGYMLGIYCDGWRGPYHRTLLLDGGTSLASSTTCPLWARLCP